MKLQTLASEVFEAIQKFEKHPSSVDLREVCMRLGEKVRDDVEIKGAFNYSETDLNVPLMAVFHQDTSCLSLFYSANGNQKFFVSFTDEKARINRMKHIDRASAPVRTVHMADPEAKTRVLEMPAYKPSPLLSLPPKPPGYFETPILKEPTSQLRSLPARPAGGHYDTPVLHAQFAPRSLPKTVVAKQCDCDECKMKMKSKLTRAKATSKASSKASSKATAGKGHAKASGRTNAGKVKHHHKK